MAGQEAGRRPKAVQYLMIVAVGDLGGGVKVQAAAMLARPAKHKLVKLAKACSPGREPNSRCHRTGSRVSVVGGALLLTINGTVG